MDISRDIRTLDELKQDTSAFMRDVRSRRRPVVITANGEPDMVIIPATLLRDKMTALKAACELAAV